MALSEILEKELPTVAKTPSFLIVDEFHMLVSQMCATLTLERAV